MILAIILATRSELPGLKGRRSTRDWSGFRIVAVRLTWIDMNCCSLAERGKDDYFSMAIGSLKLVTMFCANRISANESRKARVDSAP